MRSELLRRQRRAIACAWLLKADGAGIGTEYGNALLAEAIRFAKLAQAPAFRPAKKGQP